MRIVGPRHSRTYQPELCSELRSDFSCNSIRAFGAQAVTEQGFETWHNFAPSIFLYFA